MHRHLHEQAYLCLGGVAFQSDRFLVGAQKVSKLDLSSCSASTKDPVNLRGRTANCFPPFWPLRLASCCCCCHVLAGGSPQASQAATGFLTRSHRASSAALRLPCSQKAVGPNANDKSLSSQMWRQRRPRPQVSKMGTTLLCALDGACCCCYYFLKLAPAPSCAMLVQPQCSQDRALSVSQRRISIEASSTWSCRSEKKGT